MIETTEKCIHCYEVFLCPFLLGSKCSQDEMSSSIHYYSYILIDCLTALNNNNMNYRSVYHHLPSSGEYNLRFCPPAVKVKIIYVKLSAQFLISFLVAPGVYLFSWMFFTSPGCLANRPCQGAEVGRSPLPAAGIR